ncbi:MAG: hypothetical protein K6G24_05915 [Lachnospiraceae bacterium]|nr:hypothetical protein [Lachnospiraceae bacterium]
MTRGRKYPRYELIPWFETSRLYRPWKVTDWKGTVTAVKAGTCKIWVYAQNGLYTCCEVTVIE